jgi:hypothetical protein
MGTAEGMQTDRGGIRVKRKSKNVRFGILAATGLSALLLPIVGAGQAFADYAPQPGDVVAVGGDTPQFALEFGADGDTQGDAGYNSAGNENRLVTFNATADANARSAYAQNSTETTPIPLNATDVLRAGTAPVQRVQSSGAGISALLADTTAVDAGGGEKINFIFSASLPTPANQTTAGTNGWGFLNVVRLGTDSVQIAADNTTNAGTGLSVAELLQIYTAGPETWHTATGATGAGSTDTIIPEIPPSTSSITKTFLADLVTQNSGNPVTLGTNVVTVEQNDPTSITGLPAAQQPDAIVPFSAARLALWSSGYFHNPATVFPGASGSLSPGVKLLTATAPDSGSAYTSPITDYVIFRNSDLSSTASFQPGGTLNWVRTLFYNPGGSTPFFGSSGGLALIAASGVTPSYAELGNVHS